MSVDVSGSSSAKSEPNVVPLCDILLVLLIIFMVVTPMIKSGANVKLPDARFTSNMPEPGMLYTVYIKKDGNIFLDEKQVQNNDFTLLPKMIKARLEEDPNASEKQKRVLLKADMEVKYGLLADVLSAIREAQVEFVGLITEKKTTSGE